MNSDGDSNVILLLKKNAQFTSTRTRKYAYIKNDYISIIEIMVSGDTSSPSIGIPPTLPAVGPTSEVVSDKIVDTVVELIYSGPGAGYPCTGAGSPGAGYPCPDERTENGE
mmetsp:Transcript_16226/g.15568  ORF Transcript_16226/g.15568 Transcript_16226/m.15568 type:complete len:111 (+) Transcript_16226:2-334(+)